MTCLGVSGDLGESPGLSVVESGEIEYSRWLVGIGHCQGPMGSSTLSQEFRLTVSRDSISGAQSILELEDLWIDVEPAESLLDCRFTRRR